MLLVVDIGNTNTHFGIFDKKRLIKDWRLPTKKVQSPESRVRRVKNKIDNIIICSVVPKALMHLRQDLKRRFKISPIVVGKDIKVPLKNLYKNPKQVGQDRLVGAYAAYKKYGGPAIIVDFGTAITIDAVSKKAEYYGGVIVPGIDISLEALAKRTALLPMVKLAKPAGLIATDTANSIRSGIIYGFASLCDGIIDRFRKELKDENIPVIATGGYLRFIAPYSSRIDKINPDLVLEGLAYLMPLRQN